MYNNMNSLKRNIINNNVIYMIIKNQEIYLKIYLKS